MNRVAVALSMLFLVACSSSNTPNASEDAATAEDGGYYGPDPTCVQNGLPATSDFGAFSDQLALADGMCPYTGSMTEMVNPQCVATYNAARACGSTIDTDLVSGSAARCTTTTRLETFFGFYCAYRAYVNTLPASTRPMLSEPDGGCPDAAVTIPADGGGC